MPRIKVITIGKQGLRGPLGPVGSVDQTTAQALAVHVAETQTSLAAKADAPEGMRDRTILVGSGTWPAAGQTLSCRESEPLSGAPVWTSLSEPECYLTFTLVNGVEGPRGWFELRNWPSDNLLARSAQTDGGSDWLARHHPVDLTWTRPNGQPVDGPSCKIVTSLDEIHDATLAWQQAVDLAIQSKVYAPPEGVVTLQGNQSVAGIKTFTERVNLRASTATNASLRMPQGVSPIISQVGDVWMANSAVHVHQTNGIQTLATDANLVSGLSEKAWLEHLHSAQQVATLGSDYVLYPHLANNFGPSTSLLEVLENTGSQLQNFAVRDEDESFASVRAASYQADPEIVQWTLSGTCDHSNNGKILVIAGEGNPVITVNGATPAGYSCRIINRLEKGSTVSVVPSGIALNGSGEPLQIDPECDALLQWIDNGMFSLTGYRGETSYQRLPTSFLTGEYRRRSIEDSFSLGVAPWGNPGWHTSGAGDYAAYGAWDGSCPTGLALASGSSTGNECYALCSARATTNAHFHGKLALGVVADLTQARVRWGVGWGYQFGNDLDSLCFGIDNNTNGPAAGFSWFFNGTAISANLAVPVLDWGEWIEIVLTPVGVRYGEPYSMKTDVWKFYHSGITTHIGSSYLGEYEPAPRNVPFPTITNARPRAFIRNLGSGHRTMRLVHLGLDTAF